jgi:8-amino-7-oxononanoate synthase
MVQGTGTTGSRIANGTYGAMRRWSSGWHAFSGGACDGLHHGLPANLGTLSALAGRGDHLLLDADSHASIYDGAKLGNAQVTRFRHNDPDDFGAACACSPTSRARS